VLNEAEEEIFEVGSQDSLKFHKKKTINKV
jgi:hypothetical protein